MSESASRSQHPDLVNAALSHHQAGRLDEAAALYGQLLQLQPDHALALNLLGNVAYQQGRSDDALRLIGRAIEVEPGSPVYRIALGHVYRRLGQWLPASQCYREALTRSPASVLAAASLAHSLHELGDLLGAIEVLQQLLSVDAKHVESLQRLGDLWMAVGRPGDAVLAYQRCLDVDPGSVDVQFRLGVALSQDGDVEAAVSCLERVCELEPRRVAALYDLGVIEAERQRLEAAQRWLRRALEVDPDFVDARINLAAVLQRGGQIAEALAQREAAYRRQCLFVRPSRTALRSVLVLFDAGQGNINLSHLFSPASNTVIDWMIEYAVPGQEQALPHFDLVFNAMGDPDMTGAAAAPAERFIAGCSWPVLNRPDRVAQTSREKIPALLQGIDGLAVPKVWRVAPQVPWPSEIVQHLPVLVRPVDTHGGGGLQRVVGAGELGTIQREQNQPLYVATFADFGSKDGFYRKYRVIFIDRQPYAYHLAISPRWLVHYATAEMLDHDWKLQEEREFLSDPARVLGPVGYAAVRSIGARMDLDYAGVDFTVLPDGRIFVFEANPVMLVHPEDSHGPLAHKNLQVRRILDAFEDLLGRVGADSAAPATR